MINQMLWRLQYTDLVITQLTSRLAMVGAGIVNHNKVENYTLVYTDEDAAGNTATIIRNIIVKSASSIDITLFTIQSSNSNNSYAKAGDTLTIQSSINYTIASYTAEIFGIPQSVQNQNSKGFLISEIVPSNLTVEEYATFIVRLLLMMTDCQTDPDSICINYSCRRAVYVSIY